jgi:uncharacterized membrane protein
MYNIKFFTDNEGVMRFSFFLQIFFSSSNFCLAIIIIMYVFGITTTIILRRKFMVMVVAVRSDLITRYFWETGVYICGRK